MSDKLSLVTNDSASPDHIMDCIRRAAQFAHKHDVFKVVITVSFETDDGHTGGVMTFKEG